MDEILINKQSTINRCIKRIQEDYREDFRENFTRQDSVILNIERACQTAIDMGNRIVRRYNLGLPQSNRDTFIKLEKNKIISPELSRQMQSMAGFRNLAVHDYGSLNLDIIVNIVENHLDDLKKFAEKMVAETKG